MKLATKRSLIESHSSHASYSAADKGTGSKPGVPSVPTYGSDDEQISWKSSDEEDDDEVGMNDDDDDDNDDDDDDDADNCNNRDLSRASMNVLNANFQSEGIEHEAESRMKVIYVSMSFQGKVPSWKGNVVD
ncbi:hypothetical protein Tco_0682227 [Tanacetum coccineum]|uniref:Uncharacterized protein n=1 Tax=Tanacetum coccineum TaxID=301880 RepID=A0ABQ4XS75_9ASTR